MSILIFPQKFGQKCAFFMAKYGTFGPFQVLPTVYPIKIKSWWSKIIFTRRNWSMPRRVASDLGTAS